MQEPLYVKQSDSKAVLYFECAVEVGCLYKLRPKWLKLVGPRSCLTAQKGDAFCDPGINGAIQSQNNKAKKNKKKKNK